jgi:hypothetical protein
VRYEDALQQVLEALRAGEGLEAVLSRFPEHAGALREDVRLTSTLTRLAPAVPSASLEGRHAAAGRMQAQLASAREPAAARRSFSRGSLGRFALAAAVVVLAVVSAGLLLDSRGQTVEAGTIEGVVVENEGGTLTVQTLDALERVRVPREAIVSDGAGASISLGGIEVGQVIVVDLQRRGNQATAGRVQRFVDSIEAWCTDDSTRCRMLSASLEQAQGQCQRVPAACIVAIDRLESLRLRASDSAALEELKQRCRGGDGASCRKIVRFCREHLVVCRGLRPLEDPDLDRPLIENRLQVLDGACMQGDEAACRQLAGACNRLPEACPIDPAPAPPSVAPSPESLRNVPIAPSEARLTSPLQAGTVTPSPDRTRTEPASTLEGEADSRR